MSSPLCANCSRDSSKAGLGIGPVAQVESEKQVVAGVEVMCSHCEDVGPEVVSVPVFVGTVVKVGDPVVALTGVEATELLNLIIAVDVNVSAAEVTGPEVADPLTHVGPECKTGSVDEVSCSVVEFVFFAILSVDSVILVGPLGLVGHVPEVKVCEVESIGSVVKAGPCVPVMDSVLEAPDPVLEIRESTSASLWLRSPELMGYPGSGLTTGMTGDVGSGLVPGLRGYGVSNRLPVSEYEESVMGVSGDWQRITQLDPSDSSSSSSFITSSVSSSSSSSLLLPAYPSFACSTSSSFPLLLIEVFWMTPHLPPSSFCDAGGL